MLGKKVGITGLFTPSGEYIPVTIIKVGPCIVTQIKSKSKDGYNALQLGFEEKKLSRVTKPLQGHFNKVNSTAFTYLKEFSVDNPEDFEVGQKITVDMFNIGEHIDVTGKSKGRGFSGVMKRHGFHGGRKTHGSKSHRIPGSIGCSAWPGKVVKGKKMPGRYGNDTKTIRNLEVVDIRLDESLLMIKGPVPGHRAAMVEIKKIKFEK